MELRTASATVPSQAYVNLLKASWILTDLIAVHPQFPKTNIQVVGYDVKQLTEARSTTNLSQVLSTNIQPRQSKRNLRTSRPKNFEPPY